MLTIERFQVIRKSYGQYASWAIWAAAGDRPKDNIADLSIFDPDSNPQLLNTLTSKFVFLGLNISRQVLGTFGNFHDARPMATDFKIRAALQGTRFWGAYMTDVIKDFEQRACGNVMKYLRANPSFEQDNIASLEQELFEVGAKASLLITFGNDAEKLVKRNLGGKYTIIRIPHYAKYISAVAYRKEVNEILCSSL